MIVKQSSYAWIGLVFVLLMVGAVLATFGFTRNDLVNPISSGAAATATLSAVSYEAQFRQLSLNATSTAVALAAESDRVNARIAPTQTAVAAALEQERKTEELKHNAQMSDLGTYTFVALCLITVTAGALVVLLHAVQHERVRLAEAQAVLAAKKTELQIAEAARVEKQAAMIREQRRSLQVAAAVEAANKRKVLPFQINAPAGVDWGKSKAA